MKKEDLEYIKNTLQFALDNADFENDNYIQHFYSAANNSINVIDEEMQIMR